MQLLEGITRVVLNSLGHDVVFASSTQIAVAQVSVDHCHLPHHGHPFGTVRHSGRSVGHLGEIFTGARHRLCGSRRQGKDWQMLRQPPSSSSWSPRAWERARYRTCIQCTAFCFGAASRPPMPDTGAAASTSSSRCRAIAVASSLYPVNSIRTRPECASRTRRTWNQSPLYWSGSLASQWCREGSRTGIGCSR